MEDTRPVCDTVRSVCIPMHCMPASPIHNDPMSRTRTVAYLRVSTDKQADRGVSLDAQRAKVAAYAELYDLELVEVVVDAGASAKTLDRPGLARALGMLRKGGEAEALLVVKLDRLTRSVRDLCELVERHFAPGKAALLSVGEQIDTRSAAGRLVLNVLASVSQWEREAIGERTAAAMQHKAACGEFTGGEARPLAGASWTTASSPWRASKRWSPRRGACARRASASVLLRASSMRPACAAEPLAPSQPSRSVGW
jgi:DNA invertase Pin-like site-specific DNA recombinase